MRQKHTHVKRNTGRHKNRDTVRVIERKTHRDTLLFIVLFLGAKQSSYNKT